MNLIPNPSTVPTTVNTVLRRAAKKKVKYREVWGLARQATQLAVDYRSHSEIIEWFKEFIKSHQENNYYKYRINTKLGPSGTH